MACLLLWKLQATLITKIFVNRIGLFKNVTVGKNMQQSVEETINQSEAN